MNIIDTLNWIVVIINIAGVKWVAENDPISAQKANKLWSFTNPLIILFNIYYHTYSQAFMFTIYWIYSLAGTFGYDDPFVTLYTYVRNLIWNKKI